MRKLKDTSMIQAMPSQASGIQVSEFLGVIVNETPLSTDALNLKLSVRCAYYPLGVGREPKDCGAKTIKARIDQVSDNQISFTVPAFSFKGRFVLWGRKSITVVPVITHPNVPVGIGLTPWADSDRPAYCDSEFYVNKIPGRLVECLRRWRIVPKDIR